MTKSDNTARQNEPFSMRFDVDFQAKKCLSELELYDEYVLEINGELTATEINPDLLEKDPQYIGHIRARLIQMGRITDDEKSILELFDSFDQYFHDIYGELFDPESDGFTETLQRQFQELNAGSNVLLIDEVEVLPAFRGKKMGLAVVHRIIGVFGAWNSLVIMPIYPPQFHEHRDNIEWKEKMLAGTFAKDEDAARARLQQYWRVLGFELIWDSRYICALCTNNKYPSIQEVCPDLKLGL